MNTRRQTFLVALLVLVFCAAASTLALIIYTRLDSSEVRLSPWWLAPIMLPPLLLVAVFPFLVRTRRLPAPPQSTFQVATNVAVAVAGGVLAATGAWFNNYWFMVSGIMLYPLVAMFRGPATEKGLRESQFSLRRLFFLTTIFAVLICVVLAIERWRDNAIRDNNAKHDKAMREINEKSIRTRREIWESGRGKLSPGVYERKMKELDDEAAKLGLP